MVNDPATLLRWADVIPLVPDGVEHLLLVSAHPDDQTLGAGGLLTQVPDGVGVDVVVATDGQTTRPDGAPTHTPDGLAALDRAQVREAVALLCPRAEVHLLGLAAGGLGDQVEELTAALVPLVTGTGTLVLAPYRHDGHPDHEAAARAASAAAWRTDAALLEHRGPSQETLLVAEPGEAGPFEELHGRVADPWQVRESWFERRKRALTLAALPHERYAVAVEIGCSIGALAADLAGRCDRVVAVDESRTAVAAARAALGSRGVAVRARVPEEWDSLLAALRPDTSGAGEPGRPDGSPTDGVADLVVVSEVGYFLSPRRLAVLTGRVRSLVSGAERATVVACHWRHEIVGWPLRGDDVHAVLEAGLDLPRTSQLVEEDFVLTVWSR